MVLSALCTNQDKARCLVPAYCPKEWMTHYTFSSAGALTLGVSGKRKFVGPVQLDGYLKKSDVEGATIHEAVLVFGVCCASSDFRVELLANQRGRLVSKAAVPSYAVVPLDSHLIGPAS